jgi:hypothetical protein
MKRTFMRWLAVLAILGLVGTALYFVPPIHQRLSWRLASLQSKLYYVLHPPDRVNLGPDPQIEARVEFTLTAIAGVAVIDTPTAIPTDTPLIPSPTGTAGPVPTPTESPTPQPTPTPLPEKVTLQGIIHEYQSFNNCGPANLAMALSYWGWQGDQRVTKAALRPNDDDSNVMPDEIAGFAIAQAGMRAVVRVGGDLERLKRLLAAGFPVIVELGHQAGNDWWLGHYVVVSGYDDAYQALITQDSLIMPDLPVPYKDIQEHWWRDFNGLYIVIYPPDRETELFSILGSDSDQQENILHAISTTQAEIPNLSGRDLFFALYNQAADLLALDQVEASASAFDLAFSQYETLEDKQRPWRVMWYRADAYQAYYQSGRYQQVIDLANATLSMLSKRGLEESHYWRGMAYAALGDREKAIEDFQIALTLRPTYREAQEALSK